MTPTTARWWLWVSLTGVAAAIAGMFGFFHMLAAQDATYLGFGVLALYAACTAWLGMKIRAGDTDYRFVEHCARVMSYLGILGTFIGLAMAFQALSALPTDGTIPAGFKAEFIHGVTTKFMTSIIGLVGFLCLEMQVRILECGEVAKTTPPGWPDPLLSAQANAIRNGKVDDTEILNLFDQMERELQVHRRTGSYREVADVNHA